VPPKTAHRVPRHALPPEQLAPAQHASPYWRPGSAGHVTVEPSQLSGASQVPSAARQVVPAGETLSGGQTALPPVQRSATSQAPAAFRQTVDALAKVLAGQASLEPVQFSATSQPPAAALRQTVLAGSRVSAGHAALAPVHISARSQTPRSVRHSVLEGWNLSAGHAVLVPVQVSSSSQAPAEARQTTPAGPAPAPTHAPEGQTRWPTSQGLPVLHRAPGTHAPLHIPRPSQEPMLQGVPSPSKAFGGHAAVPEVQRSATSHSPAAARHVVLAGARASAGQVGPPSQRSSTSHAPALGRHTSPAGRPAHATIPQSVEHTPEQHISVAPQVLARSQRPATQVAVSQGPAVHVVASQVPASVGARASGAPTSAPRASRPWPASLSVGRPTQPRSGTQTSPVAQRDDESVSRQMPAAQEGSTQAVLLMQSLPTVH
jgi:hypothetical protein